jgi:hypothetical protein
MKKSLVALSFSVVAFWSIAALAQTSPTQSQPGWFLTTANPYTITLSVLFFLVSVGTAFQNGGKLFGTYQIPTNVVVVITAVLPFLTVAATTLQAAGALGFVSIWNALLGGVLSAAVNQLPQVVKLAHVDVPAAHAMIKAMAQSKTAAPTN